MPESWFEEEEFAARWSGRTLLRILGEVRRHWPQVAGFLAMVALLAVGDSYLTYLGKRLIDEGILAADLTAVFRVAALYAAVLAAQALAVFLLIYWAGVLGERVQYDLRRQMFGHLQTLSLSYFDRTRVGWIMARVTSDSSRISGLVTWGLLDTTWSLFSMLFASIFMLLLHWRLALIVLASIPLLVAAAGWFKKYILAEYRTVRRLNSQISGAFNETIMGVRVVKALCRERANLAEFSGLTGSMYRASFRAVWLSALFLPVVQLISALSIGAVVWYGGLQARWGTISIGTIQAFLGYIVFMLWPVQELARVYAEMQQAIASAERAFSLIDARPEVADRPGAAAPESLSADIEFDRVCFHYQAGKPVLEDFSLHVRRGESVALVGPTGGGKTTIVSLLCRFYEPQGGSIRIAGRDSREYTLRGLQSRIGVVLQTPHLFSGSIRENIRYGRLSATDEEVEEAARRAGAHEFISALPEGYGAEVGEGGNRLSVGQKQLVSLARAVLARPEIFVMDEATSSVDTLTEEAIRRGIEELLRGATSVLIAHRLSTIRRVDRIVVVEAGRIVETGSHAELIRARGRYYGLYTRQFFLERGAELLT